MNPSCGSLPRRSSARHTLKGRRRTRGIAVKGHSDDVASLDLKVCPTGPASHPSRSCCSSSTRSPARRPLAHGRWLESAAGCDHRRSSCARCSPRGSLLLAFDCCTPAPRRGCSAAAAAAAPGRRGAPRLVVAVRALPRSRSRSRTSRSSRSRSSTRSSRRPARATRCSPARRSGSSARRRACSPSSRSSSPASRCARSSSRGAARARQVRAALLDGWGENWIVPAPALPLAACVAARPTAAAAAAKRPGRGRGGRGRGRRGGRRRRDRPRPGALPRRRVRRRRATLDALAARHAARRRRAPPLLSGSLAVASAALAPVALALSSRARSRAARARRPLAPRALAGVLAALAGGGGNRRVYRGVGVALVSSLTFSGSPRPWKRRSRVEGSAGALGVGSVQCVAENMLG